MMMIVVMLKIHVLDMYRMIVLFSLEFNSISKKKREQELECQLVINMYKNGVYN